MIVVAGFSAVVCFLLAFQRLGVPAAASRALRTSRRGFESISNEAMSDAEKERAVRQASIHLFQSVLSMSARTAGAFLVSLIPLLLFQLTGLASIDDVAGFLATWPAIISISILMTAWFLVWRRR